MEATHMQELEPSPQISEVQLHNGGHEGSASLKIQSSTDPFVGKTIKLKGMQHTPELNGTCGTVLALRSFKVGGGFRCGYLVHHDNGRVLRIFPPNLEIAENSAQPATKRGERPPQRKEQRASDPHGWLRTATYSQLKRHLQSIGVSATQLQSCRGRQALLLLLQDVHGVSLRLKPQPSLTSKWRVLPHLRPLLLGTACTGCVLSLLEGQVGVLQLICQQVAADWQRRWSSQVCFATAQVRYFHAVQRVAFPAPSGININMMPILIGDRSSIPVAYQQYLPLLQACVAWQAERGEVGYLTVQEGVVAAGQSQRRPGLHTDALTLPSSMQGKQLCRVYDYGVGWGGGHCRHEDLQGGIYIANTVEHSCKVWNAKVQPGPGGQVEHLREILGAGLPLKKDTLYWLTDCTPHEAIAQQEAGPRQFFRLVTSRVSIWYAAHSTANPLGVQPMATISYEDKFAC